jgi:hypothetical protein
MSTVDPGAKISAVRKLHPQFRTHPLWLKVDRQGGSGMAFIVVDLGALIWTIGKVRPRFWTPPPPPPLKGRKARGVWNPICTIDSGAWMPAVHICLLLTTNSGPPPPLLHLKVEGRGGSRIRCAPLIEVHKSQPSKIDSRLTQMHSCPKLRTNGFLTLSFAF